MIRKLRWKFIAVIMVVVCLFLFGILSSLFFSAQRNYERRSEMVLLQSVERNFPIRERGPFNEGFPVISVSVNALGRITINQNQLHYINDEDIPALIDAIDATNSDSGLIYDTLRFMKRSYLNGETRYALIDNYIDQTALRTLGTYSLVIGLGAAALFFLVSVLLSRWLIAPVETAINRLRQFVADASHELKTPLTVILSNTDMLIRSNAVQDARNRTRLENIDAESQHMRGLVDDLLSLARSDSTAPAELTREAVSLSYIVSHSVLTLEPAIFDKGRKLETWITDGQSVIGDPSRLRQLMDILLDNALKYSDPDTTIEVRLEPYGKREVLLSIKSRGAPIPNEDLSNIFERFYRSDKSRGQEKGYGLGLAIAQSIVKDHGGRIWAQTDGEKSNAFFVRLNTVNVPVEETRNAT